MKRVRVISFLFVLSAGLILFTTLVGAQKKTPARDPFSLIEDSLQNPDNQQRKVDIGPSATLAVGILNPYCYQPNPTVDACYVNWRMINAQTDATLVELTIKINNRMVARHFGGGTLIEVPYTKNDIGYKVKCGRLNSGGDPEMGYKYRVNARATNNADMNVAWYQDVYCPAAVGPVPVSLP